MQHITPHEVKKKLVVEKKIYLIDVRELYEHNSFNIGGKLLPVGQLENTNAKDIAPTMDVEIICYCHSGVRSQVACAILERKGFVNVFNMVGGVVAWETDL